MTKVWQGQKTRIERRVAVKKNPTNTDWRQACLAHNFYAPILFAVVNTLNLCVKNPWCQIKKSTTITILQTPDDDDNSVENSMRELTDDSKLVWRLQNQCVADALPIFTASAYFQPTLASK